MPKFKVVCSTTKSYCLTVEAPSKEAAERWYDKSDGGEFHSYGGELGWELDELYKVPDTEEADIKVNIDGVTITLEDTTAEETLT